MAHRGERVINRKAIAQGMSDCLRCPVCSCAHFLCTLRMRPRVQRASGIPCAERASRFEQYPDASRRGNAESHHHSRPSEVPSILLSGFMFPFAGMPVWAQYIGEGLPLTHYLRIVRAIMLKGSTLANLQYDTIALAALMLIAMTIAVTRFRRTLD